jgi:DNA/RNA endonuclease YhcR with UshA esterase domain
MNRRITALLGAWGCWTAGLGVSASLQAGQAQAHHAFAMFDVSKEVTLEGTVKAFQWTNPHSWVELLVKDAAGKEVEWSIEGSSPNNLARFGWRSTSIKAGDHVQAVIHPMKDGTVGGSLIKMTVNGQVIGAPKPS